jgi:hypothetical protein
MLIGQECDIRHCTTYLEDCVAGAECLPCAAAQAWLSICLRLLDRESAAKKYFTLSRDVKENIRRAL